VGLEVAQLVAQGAAPVRHHARVAAEDDLDGVLQDPAQASHQGGQVGVVRQRGGTAGQEEVACEEPARLRHEQARHVVGDAGGSHGVQREAVAVVFGPEA